MMKGVGLDNFKTFARLELSLGSLTLLSGLNGAGKSTVIQSLAMLRQSYDASFLENGSWLLNGDLVDLGTGQDVLCEQFDRERLAVTLHLADGTSVCWPAAHEPAANVLHRPDGEAIARTDPRIPLFAKGFQYLRADRINPAVTFPKSHHAVRNRRFLGARGEYTPHFLLEFGDSEVPTAALVHAEEPTARSINAQVNVWMQTFSPGVRISVFDVPRTDFVRLGFNYRGRGVPSDTQHRATNVGFGLTYALPLVVAVLAAQPGTLLLIENPEAHLHPQGQLAIGDLLARAAQAGIQVVIETHSDHVLNGIRLAVKRKRLDPTSTRLHFFQRDPAGSVEIHSPTVDEHGLLSEWPPGFFTQWDDAVLDLLS